MNLSKRTLRRMDNLYGICDFDTGNKIAKVYMNYASADELLDLTLSSSERPVISKEMQRYLRDIPELVPDIFNVELILNVDDYCGYDPGKLTGAVEAAFKAADFSKKKDNNRKNRLMKLSLFFSIFFFAVVVLARANGVFDSSGKPLILMIVIIFYFIFEMYFDQGIEYFTVLKSHRLITKEKESRIKRVSIK